MQFANKSLIAGLLTGILLTIGGFGIYAHAGHSDGHDMHNDNRLSTTGSPDELAKRTRSLGEHICETIKAASDCPVTPVADEAVKALSGMQDNYQHGQERMHELLTSADFDRDGFSQIQTAQAQAIQASAMRYMQFLADAAAALTPEQRQMFSRKGPAGS